MKSVLLIKDTTANKISYYHLMLLLLSLPYDMFYSHIILISLVIHTAIHFKKADMQPVFTRTNVWLSSLFFLTLSGTLYTQQRSIGFEEAGRQIVLVLIPLIFCFNPLDIKKYRDSLLLVFSWGCVAAIAYLYLHAFMVIRYYHYPAATLLSPAFINHNFSQPFDIHATYFAMQVALALVYLVVASIKQVVLKHQLLNVFGCLVLSAGIIQLGSKSVFIALLLIINLVIPYFLLTTKHRLRFMFVSILFSLLIIGGIYSTNTLKGRYVVTLKEDLRGATDDELTDPRWARWELAMQVAAQKPVIGHGAGSETGLLKDVYFEHKFYRSYLTALNAHNQFISMLIKYGIAGLVVFLLTLAFGFKTAWEKRDVLLFAFLMVMVTVSLAENVMDRDKGVFFYSIFFSLLIFAGQTNKKALSYDAAR